MPVVCLHVLMECRANTSRGCSLSISSHLEFAWEEEVMEVKRWQTWSPGICIPLPVHILRERNSCFGRALQHLHSLGGFLGVEGCVWLNLTSPEPVISPVGEISSRLTPLDKHVKTALF